MRLSPFALLPWRDDRIQFGDRQTGDTAFLNRDLEEPAFRVPMRQDELTPREIEVFGLVAQGRTSKQIAEALAISVHTVNNHRKRICRKVGVHSTAELVAFAARHFMALERPAPERAGLQAAALQPTA
jgi:DNA-binding CsgD family transcriptional regulator